MPSWASWVSERRRAWGRARHLGWPGLTGLSVPVSDRDRNLMVYMYLPEGEWTLSSPRRGGVGRDEAAVT